MINILNELKYTEGYRNITTSVTAFSIRHPWIWINARDFKTNPPWILRDD